MLGISRGKEGSRTRTQPLSRCDRSSYVLRLLCSHREHSEYMSEGKNPRFDRGAALFEKYAATRYPEPAEKQQFLRYAKHYTLVYMTDLNTYVAARPNKRKALLEWANRYKASDIANPPKDLLDEIHEKAGEAAARALEPEPEWVSEAMKRPT